MIFPDLSMRNVARLAGRMARRNQKDVTLAARLAHIHVESLVLLFIHQSIRARSSRRMPVHSVLPLGLRILDRVKKCLVVVRPCHRAHSLRMVRERFSRS